jgi:hypothetical protein
MQNLDSTAVFQEMLNEIKVLIFSSTDLKFILQAEEQRDLT